MDEAYLIYQWNTLWITMWQHVWCTWSQGKIQLSLRHNGHTTRLSHNCTHTVWELIRYVKIMLNYTNMLLLEIFKRYFEGFVHYLKGILKTDKMLKLFKMLSWHFRQKYDYIIKDVFHVSLQYFQWKYWFPHPVTVPSYSGHVGRFSKTVYTPGTLSIVLIRYAYYDQILKTVM